MRLLACALTTACLLGLSAAAAAHDGPHAPGEGHDAAASTASEDSVVNAQQQLVAARQRLDRAEAAYTLMLSRNYPRGDARGQIVAERDAARAEWDRLAAAHPDLAAALGPAPN